jgi:hypothetical protein
MRRGCENSQKVGSRILKDSRLCSSHEHLNIFDKNIIIEKEFIDCPSPRIIVLFFVNCPSSLDNLLSSSLTNDI